MGYSGQLLCYRQWADVTNASYLLEPMCDDALVAAEHYHTVEYME